MSSRQHQSPILFEQSISPPHLLSPELIPAATISPPVRPLHAAELQPSEQQQQPRSEPVSEERTSNMDAQPESVSASAATAETSTSPSSAATAEATADTNPEPSESAPASAPTDSVTPVQDTPQGIPQDTATQIDDQSSTTTTQESSTVEPTESTPATNGTATENDTENAGNSEPATDAAPEAATGQDAPAPPEPVPEPTTEPEPEPVPEDTAPSWVKFEEDTSVPDEEELKEIEEAEKSKNSASSITALEEQFFPDLDDAELRPAKKLRMSWIIKGVRGTRDRPNMARIMHSPAVCVNGMYWSIKFYPRGDKCESLSAFVRCSRVPPKQADEMPEHTFTFFEGSPGTVFTDNYEPTVKISVPNTQRVREQPKTKSKDEQTAEDKKNEGEGSSAPRDPSQSPPSEADSTDSHEDDDDDGSNEGNDDVDEKDLEDWRVSAQLGMSIYNPDEPRVSHFQSDGHQFSQHIDDWGWVNFIGPWDELHQRKRGQRRPLLQNDTLAIDAYVQIYDDPTQALWWHDTKVENQWPSKLLAGFYPMGTPALYHSPAVAGITAWVLLAPFRKALQAFDGGKWLRDSHITPKPLICQTQLVLQQLRKVVGDCFVNVYKIIEELMEADEPWEDVKSFWEVYRRGLEFELRGDATALQALSSIFDAGGTPFKMPRLSVPGDEDVASGLERYFSKTSYKGALPNFLPVMLNRQEFDQKKREWILHQDRIKLSDELDLTKFSTDDDAKYTLYGFVVHVNARASGKFYSILRPGGINSKWLSFEDGNGNKVFSYTKKRVQEFEGLEGDELKNFSDDREKAYMALYIRNTRWSEYLPAEMEPYCLPKWLRSYVHGSVEVDETVEKEETIQADTEKKQQDDEGVKVELYLDESISGRENMLELHDLRCAITAATSYQTVRVATDKTLSDLRTKLAESLEVADASKILLWDVCYRGVGKFSRAHLEALSYRRKVRKYVHPGDTVRLWVSVLPHEGKEESYQQKLPKITEMGLEKKNPVEEPVEAPAVTESTDKDKDNDTPVDESAPAADQPTPEPNQQPMDATSNHTEDSTTTGIATPATGETSDSLVDAEQASVQAAVTQDIEQASAQQNALDTQASSSVEPIEPPSLEPATQVEDSHDTEVEEATPAATPTPNVPLEHNHLVEAVQASEPAQTTESNVVQTDADQSTLAPAEGAVPPSDEISPEDAAAIAALLAADAEDEAAARAAAAAAESAEQQATDAQTTENNDAAPPADTTETAPDAEAQRPPTPPIMRVYGFVHTFDVDNQKLVAQCAFHPEVDSEIGSTLRKTLKYDEEKEIKVWKRDGPTGTAPITLTSTFGSCSFDDGFTLIVGDYISEERIEELKQKGKFWQPSQLIKYLLMSKRGHPFLSATSVEPVEISEFGGDYFKGPVVNGQPHGGDCVLITSSGHTYKGPLVAGLKSGGKGKITYQNGDTYEGEWLNDECHGQGEYIEARTGNRYVGGYENGKRWGEGVTYWKVADQQAAMCQVCYGEEIDALFFDCGHVCACVECAKQCENCPICRKAVRQVVKMYRA